jgi:hypothetical protein
VIIASDETPSASGVLLGNDPVTGDTFLQLPLPINNRVDTRIRKWRDVFIGGRFQILKLQKTIIFATAKWRVPLTVRSSVSHRQ